MDLVLCEIQPEHEVNKFKIEDFRIRLKERVCLLTENYDYLAKGGSITRITVANNDTIINLQVRIFA